MTDLLVLMDTNIVSHIMRRPEGKAGHKLADYEFGQVGISSIVLSELLYGVEKSGSVRLQLQLDFLVRRLIHVPYDEDVALCYAQVRAGLERSGTPIGPLDTLIAAHALALDLPLVTDNTREFSRVPNLRVENWLD
jgi:tRNA(fMet)-specific endonuclease VapC